MERKVFECPFSLKQVSETGQFEGHAAVFSNIDLQGDRIKRGAFKESIEESAGRWPVLMGHNTGRVVGFSTAAEEDSKGLRVEGEFTLASDEGRNAYAVAKHAAQLGQKFGLSIGYAVREGGADFDAETGIRTLKNLTVYEFSLAAIPANPRARITNVKQLGECKTVREVEQWLREHGATGDDARAMISLCRGKRDANLGGDDDDPERDAKDTGAVALRDLIAETRLLDLYHFVKGQQIYAD